MGPLYLFLFVVVCQSKPFDMKIFGYHRFHIASPLKNTLLGCKVKNLWLCEFHDIRFLLGCNYDLLLKIKTCDRCRHDKPPGSPLSSGIANTAALGTGFQQSDKRNMGSIVAVPACYQ
jgi:hypothetical protein